MKKACIVALLLLISIATFAQKAEQYVKIETPQAWCIVKLYNETPVHRDNFIRLAKMGYWDKTTFNRILKGFVIQGGDQDSLYDSLHVRNAEQKWIAAELRPNLYHKRGILAMGRDDNKTQASFTTQIYFVDGRTYTNEQLDAIEKRYHNHFIEEQRKVYNTVGGTPSLDQHYTVFGEIVKGIDFIDKVTAVKVNKDGNPDTPVPMKVTLLKAKDAQKALKAE
ncbi:peptidylprolyl isomerase [Mucilaginibacter pedocola]|uniref:peptidylprolyl isomerase n=1 Tax=Mucilaginibacter pedocola TaxID=1792845 RepID=A0A1S9PFV3_9SPHI|nr:peptidylprolyl isomerase [Mucilaginibacter pedocola]OOQ59820.1 peptidylprolyl isomerase [Mucilaginibacter pedocola]